jgi:hypothetical protein
MRRPLLPVVVVGLSVLALLWGFVAFMGPYPGYGPWGMMGPGRMMGPGMGSGYGRCAPPGFGPSATGPGWSAPWTDLNLTTDNAKTCFDRWLAWQGNQRLKVGDVKEKDAGLITVDVVTKDNSLVQRFVVDRRTGWSRPSED